MDGGLNKTRRTADRIRSIFREKFKVKNNFRGIVPLDTSIQENNTSVQSFSIQETFKGKKKGGGGSTKKKKKGGGTKKKKKKKGKKGKKKKKKKKGNNENKASAFLRNNVFFLFPTFLRILAKTIVQITPSGIYDKKGTAADNNRNDEEWLFSSFVEFCNIWLAFGLANMIEAFLDKNCYKTVLSMFIEYVQKTLIESADLITFCVAFFYPIFAPSQLFSFLIDLLPRVLGEEKEASGVEASGGGAGWKGSGGGGDFLPMLKNVSKNSLELGNMLVNEEINKKTRTKDKILVECKPFLGNNVPNINFVVYFISALSFCMYFLTAFVNMLLKSLSFKSSGFMYIFIGVAFLKMFILKFINYITHVELISMGSPVWFISTLFQALICLFLAPVAQLILFLELCAFFIRSFYTLFSNVLAREELKRRENTNPVGFSHRMDNFFWKYVVGNNPLFLGFVFLLFFIFKSISAVVTMKKMWLRIQFFVINLAAFVFFMYRVYINNKQSTSTSTNTNSSTDS